MVEHEYNANDLERLTCVEHIQRRPKMFFHADGVRDIHEFVSRLASDPRDLGAANVQTALIDGWHVVSADLDWLPDRFEDGKCSPSENFENMIQIPNEQYSSFHYAVFVTALAEKAVTISQETRHVIAGAVQDDDDIWKYGLPDGMKRSLAFSLNPKIFVG